MPRCHCQVAGNVFPRGLLAGGCRRSPAALVPYGGNLQSAAQGLLCVRVHTSENPPDFNFTGTCSPALVAAFMKASRRPEEKLPSRNTLHVVTRGAALHKDESAAVFVIQSVLSLMYRHDMKTIKRTAAFGKSGAADDLMRLNFVGTCASFCSLAAQEVFRLGKHDEAMATLAPQIFT